MDSIIERLHANDSCVLPTSFCSCVTANQTLSTLKPLRVAVKYYGHIERTHFIPLRWWMPLPLGTDILVSFLLFDLRLPLNWNGSRKRCQSVAWRLLLFSITCRQSCIRLHPHRWFMLCPNMILWHFYSLGWIVFSCLFGWIRCWFPFVFCTAKAEKISLNLLLKAWSRVKNWHWSNLWLDNACLMVGVGFGVSGSGGVPNTCKWLMLDLEGQSRPTRRETNGRVWLQQVNKVK